MDQMDRYQEAETMLKENTMVMSNNKVHVKSN